MSNCPYVVYLPFPPTTPPQAPDPDTRALYMANNYVGGALGMADSALSAAQSAIASLSQLGEIGAGAGITVSMPDLPPRWNAEPIGTVTIAGIDPIELPVLNFNYEEIEYVSTLLNDLKAKLLDNVVNGREGLSGTEQDMFDEGSEEELQELSDSIDSYALKWAENGCYLPDGLLVAGITRADIGYQKKKFDKSRKIAEESYKIATDNQKKSELMSVRLEDICMKFNNATNKIKLDAAVAIIEAGIKIFDAIVKERLAIVDIYKAKVQVYEANAKAKAVEIGIEVEEFKSDINLNNAVSDVELKNIEIMIKQEELRVHVLLGVAKAAATAASQLASSGMSAVNIGASLGYNFHDSFEWQWSGSNAYRTGDAWNDRFTTSVECTDRYNYSGD